MIKNLGLELQESVAKWEATEQRCGITYSSEDCRSQMQP